MATITDYRGVHSPCETLFGSHCWHLPKLVDSAAMSSPSTPPPDDPPDVNGAAMTGGAQEASDASDADPAKLHAAIVEAPSSVAGLQAAGAVAPLPSSSSPAAAPEPAEGDSWSVLHPATEVLWRIQMSTLPGLLGTVGVVLACLGVWREDVLLAVIAGGLGLGFLAVVALWPRWYARRAYASTGYRVSDRIVEHRRGIFWRTTVAIPLSRLQHVDLQSGPLDRWLGIATLRLFTGGTKDALHEIHGLAADQARALRDRLLQAGGSGVG